MVNELVVRAAKMGDNEEISKLLKSGATDMLTGDKIDVVNAMYNISCGYTSPLMEAARAGHLKTVEFLLKNKANVNQKNHYGFRESVYPNEQHYTAFYFAALSGHTDIVKVLLKHKANPNESYMGESIFTTVAYNGQVEIVKVLLQYNKENQNKEIKKEKEINKVKEINKDKDNMYKKEIKKEKDIKQNRENETEMEHRDQISLALYYAALNGHNEVVKLLLEQNVDPNLSTNDSRKGDCTALIIAAEYGRAETLKVLLESKANVNVKQKDGCTALHSAAREGHTQAVRILLEHRADVHAKAVGLYNLTNEVTPLVSALGPKNHRPRYHRQSFKDPEVVKLLLQYKSSVRTQIKFNSSDENDFSSVLFYAITQDRSEVFQMLVNHHDADLQEKNNKGNDLLTVASRLGCTEIVRILENKFKALKSELSKHEASKLELSKHETSKPELNKLEIDKPEASMTIQFNTLQSEPDLQLGGKVKPNKSNKI